jgi:hypothetical protein
LRLKIIVFLSKRALLRSLTGFVHKSVDFLQLHFNLGHQLDITLRLESTHLLNKLAHAIADVGNGLFLRLRVIRIHYHGKFLNLFQAVGGFKLFKVIAVDDLVEHEYMVNLLSDEVFGRQILPKLKQLVWQIYRLFISLSLRFKAVKLVKELVLQLFKLNQQELL